ncbi:ATP-binding protein [Nocardiopsis mangrovi]|uniref:ATP-binding protein n=1 Tax=Nocardiopsis mangrovi TaxID=1179818 RepID=A0ABV9E328_9ACTN
MTRDDTGGPGPAGRAGDGSGNGPGNTLRGDAGAVVQAGAIHGDVHVTAAGVTGTAVPRQLPMAAAGFVNRGAEIARLDALLPTPGDDPPHGPGAAAVVISAIGGTPGVGKTALAVHWAHRVRAHFPDGDLYADLRGHGPGRRLGPSETPASFLHALDVPPDRIPIDLDGRAALYRSRLDGKRMLIVIDDAVSADQVRPLLPAAAGCMAVVTGRTRLSGLVARDGARPMTVGTLSAPAALDLLRGTVADGRIDDEPEAARALVAHCAGLPLALRIAAERLLDRAGEPVSALVADLAAEDRRLDALGAGDDELSDVRAVFSASYSGLSPDTARLFRHLGPHPGAEFGAEVCAAVSGFSPRHTAAVVDRLVRANLVQRVGRDRYRLHDLLRLYAIERFRADEGPGAAEAVVRRYGLWYLATARNAVRVVHPGYPPVDDPGGDAPVSPLVFDTVAAALSWFERDRPNLVGSVNAAVGTGQLDLAWRIPATAGGLFGRHGHREEWRDIHRQGADAARAAGDPFGTGRNLLGLGEAEWVLGRTDAALETYDAALAANREAGDGWGEGFALRISGQLRWERDRDGHAPELIRRAVTVFRAIGERRGEGMALLSLAGCDRDVGRLDEALAACRAAIGIFTGIGDRWTIAWARCSTGSVLHAMGRRPEAVAEYLAAAAEFRELQDRDSEAAALIGAGDAYAADGDPEGARTHLGAALDLLSAEDDPRVPEVEAKLAALR